MILGLLNSDSEIIKEYINNGYTFIEGNKSIDEVFKKI